jgi:DNA-binding transcriptional MerR regulator
LPKEAALCHKNRSVRKKDEDKTRDAWLSAGNDAYSSDEDGDDVDEVLHAEEGFHITELRDAAPGRHHKQEFSAPLPESHLALTAEQAQQILQEIEEKPDQALRKLLLDADFQFQLLLHQFFAVRKVAGVPEKFPLHPGSEVQQPATASIQQAIQGLDLDQNKCSTRGVLIADQMGLGKTVEAIAGAILRNALAAAKGEKERPTVIFSPNDAVQVQWRDTLYKNGVPLERIQMFQKGQRSTDFDKAIFLLLTRHRLQSEVKRVFGNLEQAAKHPHMATSVLFSHVTIENLVRLKVQYQDENSKMRVTNSYRKKGRKHERLRHATHQPL